MWQSPLFWPVVAMTGVALLLIYPTVVLRRYVRIMINILDDLALPDRLNGDAMELVGDEVVFRALDGHRLSGTMIQAAGKPRGAIIFAHEFGRVRSSCHRYCRPLWEAGFDVFAFDFRGHGASAHEEGYRPRQWPSDRERADMLGAIAHVESYLKQSGRPSDVGLFGISRGAGAAILAAVEMDNVRAIVTDGAFSSDCTLEYMMCRFAKTFARIRIVAENHPPLFWRFFRWLVLRECTRKFHCRFPSVRKALMRLEDKAILFIHGAKDSYIPVAQSESLYASAKGPKQLWIVPGAAHNQSVRMAPDEYARRTLSFFDQHLARDSKEFVEVTESIELSASRHQPASSPLMPQAAALAAVGTNPATEDSVD